MNKAISNLPFVIVAYWLLCLYFYHSAFYLENYLMLDLLDTIPVVISVFHFFICMVFYQDVYSPYKGILIYTIIFCCLIAHFKLEFGADLYISAYKSTLFGGIVLALLTYFITRRK
jgi:hypothetical protein